jgi:hypothetical protein
MPVKLLMVIALIFNIATMDQMVPTFSFAVVKKGGGRDKPLVPRNLA